MGLLQGSCQLAPIGAAKGPSSPGSPSQGRLLGGATARHCSHLLSLLLPSALFALGRAVLPVHQCSVWPRWLWKLSRHCQGDTLAIEPSPPHQPPAHPHTASKLLWGPWASLLHWRVMGVFAGRFNQCLLSLPGSKAPFCLWKRIRINQAGINQKAEICKFSNETSGAVGPALSVVLFQPQFALLQPLTALVSFLAQSPTQAEIPSALHHQLNSSACCLQSNKQLKLVESLI